MDAPRCVSQDFPRYPLQVPGRDKNSQRQQTFQHEWPPTVRPHLTFSKDFRVSSWAAHQCRGLDECLMQATLSCLLCDFSSLEFCKNCKNI